MSKKTQAKIACYVGQVGDSYEIYLPGNLSALEYISPEEDVIRGEVLEFKTSGDFRERPYFLVYATTHGIPKTRDMVRQVLGDLEKMIEASVDIGKANRALFINLAKKGDCSVGTIIYP